MSQQAIQHTTAKPVKQNGVPNEKWQALIESEKHIQDAWVKAGIALKRIRDDRLYELRGYDSFVAYYQQEFGYHKSTVSRYISASTARVDILKKVSHPSLSASGHTVFRELSVIPADERIHISKRAVEIAAGDGAGRVMSKHVKQARQEHQKYTIANEVTQVAQKYGFTGDSERISILQRWYDNQTDEHSKFQAVRDSGVLDPADGNDPIHFATATIEAIVRLEKRWQQTRIQLANDKTVLITGTVNQASLVINGQNVAHNWKGKRVRIRYEFLD